ncbi:hypothetical protein ACH4ZU_11835 [Streptomyces sp. NPDC020472]|uniref:hypothetical protein n=1 Tax=Streptomyces sp. NPDC020472 TaxID=3365075 RepID=UPI0037A3E247
MSNDISEDPWAQRVYLTWLARDTRYALAALDALMDYSQQTPAPPAAWVAFEDFLNFTGKISRTLWPIEKKGPKGTPEGLIWRKGRGSYLREVLEVSDSSPLEAREVRNGSEHFDERLDEWIVHLPRPTAEEWQAGIRPEFAAPPMRLVDVEAGTIQVDGAQLDLRLMDKELRRLLAKIGELEPSVAALPHEMAALLAASAPIPVIPFDAPAQNPGGIQAWLDERKSADPPPQDRHTAPEDTKE